MIDLGVQAQEAATRSQTLAVANQAVEASRGETPHPAVARTLAGTAPRESASQDRGAAPLAAERKANAGANRSETSQDEAERTDGKTPRREARPEPTPAERAERLALLQSPARGIASAMRIKKHTGKIECDHTGEVSVWHLIGHMADAANRVRGYAYSGLVAGTKGGSPKESQGPGLMDGLRSGYSAGRTGTPAAAIAATALAADGEGAKPSQKPVPRRERDGGMER